MRSLKIQILLVLLNFYQITYSYILKNTGLLPTEVKGWMKLNSYDLFFLEDGISFVKIDTLKKEIYRSDFKFKDKNINCQIIFEGENYAPQIYIKNNNQYITKSYKKIIYKDVWQGIDIVFYSPVNKNKVKFDIKFDSKVDMSCVQIQYIGNEILEKSDDGQIILRNDSNKFIKIEPLLSYHDRTERGNLKSLFDLIENEKIIKLKSPLNTKFNQPLLIEPWISLVGTPDQDIANDVKIDSFENVYICGYTNSLIFPTTPGVMQMNNNGDYDAFIFKFNKNGQRIWSTYFGGTAYDFGIKLLLNDQNQPILTGYSYSNDLFVGPAGNVHSTNFFGIFDAFILKLDSNGQFQWATYFGGNGGDYVTSADFKNNKILISGFTTSNNLPITSQSYQQFHSGGLDAFYAEFDANGNLNYTTYFGGSSSEDSHAIKYDKNNNIIMAGETYSTDLPISANAIQSNNNGISDAYYCIFSPNHSLLYSTYIGGNNIDDINSISCNKFNQILLSGYSKSNDFPVTSSAFQSILKGQSDGIVIYLDSNFIPIYSSYLGGDSIDYIQSTVGKDKYHLLTGETFSNNFPVVGNYFFSNLQGQSDVFYTVLDENSNIVYSTYFGGSKKDAGTSIATFNEIVAITGFTFSNDFPTSQNVFQSTYQGEEDIFVWLLDTGQGVPLGQLYKHEIYQVTNRSIIYPNPTNSSFKLTKDFNKVVIYTQNYKEILMIRKYKKNTLINLPFEKGIYIIIAEYDTNDIEIFKLIKY